MGAWIIWLRDETGSFEKISYCGRAEEYLGNDSLTGGSANGHGAFDSLVSHKKLVCSIEVGNSGRTVQYKLDAQSLRLFGLHSET